MTRTRAGLLLASALVLVGGCGDKITLPEAEGIAIVSDYFEVTPASLRDELGWITDVEPFGGILAVSDSSGGRVLLLFDDGRVNSSRPPVEGLEAPIALSRDAERSLLLAVESTPSGFNVVTIDTRLEIDDRLPLGDEVESVSDVVSDGEHLYVGDPVRRTVHRFSLGSGAGFGPLTYQGTMVAPDPELFDRFSPQVVRTPAGMTLDEDGFVIVCDADTTRNWVLRYDPLAPPEAENEPGRAVIFGPDRERIAEGPESFDESKRCGDIFSIDASTLGLAPGCSPSADFRADPSTADGEFHAPSGVALDGAGNIYVADRFNGRIQRFSRDGDFDTSFGPGLSQDDDDLREPARLAAWDGFAITPSATIDIPGARIFVVDGATGRLRIYEDSRWTPFRNQG